ncbi:unnamed protein product [Rotaria socialis]|uniref:Tetraspanin n=2 Tax=Rotaria socialis TaxID=392032 RepID=A0A820HXX9_9BILA|nr:unnamed protein product [Rotaria socialis]CAF4302158.1 unnamed protein product [Rotaria socialis]
MKLSHELIRLILRITYGLGAFFGLLVFSFELFIQRNMLNAIFQAFYLIACGAILYLLFARKQPNKLFSYGIFYAMSFVIVLFLFSDIYELITIVSKMKNELISHIEENKELNPSIKAIIEISKCCSIDDQRHTEQNFQSFQTKYSDTCSEVEFDDAKSCLPFIRNQRNLMIFLDSITTLLRLLVLVLLWKYIKHEHDNNKDEPINLSHFDGQHSKGNVQA